MVTSPFQNIFKILNWRMLNNKNELFLQKKTTPPIEGRALLNKCIIAPFMQKAS
jgi:hypothetical protein